VAFGGQHVYRHDPNRRNLWPTEPRILIELVSNTPREAYRKFKDSGLLAEGSTAQQAWPVVDQS
jgi:hypothetical protein